MDLVDGLVHHLRDTLISVVSRYGEDIGHDPGPVHVGADRPWLVCDLMGDRLGRLQHDHSRQHVQHTTK